MAWDEHVIGRVESASLDVPESVILKRWSILLGVYLSRLDDLWLER